VSVYSICSSLQYCSWTSAKTAVYADAEVNKYIKQVDELDERVSDLEAIVRELEEWTGELGWSLLIYPHRSGTDDCAEIKVRRIVPRR
jgi:tetrahydromethanopterin S-methyltransferase subunit B